MTHDAMQVDWLHTLCLNDTQAGPQDQLPDSNLPPHHGTSSCCLMSGAGDLPRLQAIISVFAYSVETGSDPQVAFLQIVYDSKAYAPVLPRAPPMMG